MTKLMTNTTVSQRTQDSLDTEKDCVFCSYSRHLSNSFSYGSELALLEGMKWESREASLLLTEPSLPSGTGHFPGRWKIWLIRELNQHLRLAAWALHLASLTAKCSPIFYALPLPPAAFFFLNLLAWSLTFPTHSFCVSYTRLLQFPSPSLHSDQFQSVS